VLAIAQLSQDLPAIWSAETTAAQETEAADADRDRIGAVGWNPTGGTDRNSDSLAFWYNHIAKRPAPGAGSLKTTAEAVLQIHRMAGRNSYKEIAASS